MTSLDDTWMTVEVRTKHPNVGSLSVVVRYRDYDVQLLDDGVLRVVLQDRSEVHLYAPGEWTHYAAKPVPEDVAADLDKEEP